jgi:hypothetical protein
MRRRFRCLLPLLLLFPLATTSAADSPVGLSYVETPDVRVVYFDSLDYLVSHAARTAINSLAWQRRVFDWRPSQKPTVLLKDFSDYANAAAAARNRLYMEVAPMSHVFETYPATERMYTLMNHEMNHISQGDVGSETERAWRRRFLGEVTPIPQNPETLLYSYLTIPRYALPRWYAEGSAVFMETWMAGGIGRAQGGYDEMVFRAMVRDDAHFYDALGLVARGTLVDFQVMSNAYLYGTRFFTWLAYRHSPERVVEWLKLGDTSRRYYADNFQQVFGLSLEQAWRDWIEFEHEFQRRNLASVRQHPVTPYRALTTRALGSISRLHYDESAGKLYAAFRYPGVVEHVGALDLRDGSIRRLADIKRAMLYRVSSFAYDPQSHTAFYTNDNTTLRDLKAVDVETGDDRMLLENSRIGDIAFNRVDRSLIGVRHDNGLASLVRIPYPYTDGWQVLHTFPYEHVPYDLDISPDGRLLSASMSEANADQFLRVWDIDRLAQGDLRPLSESKFGQSIPESFVFSPDGRFLYGSSYYTGVSNVYRYDIGSGDLVAMSNAETGFFRPVPLSDGRLLVLTYTGEGFVPAIIDAKPLEDLSAITFLGAEVAAKHPVVTTWQVPPAGEVNLESAVTARGPYDPVREVRLSTAYPVLQGYKDAAGFGYRFNFTDPIELANVDFTVAHTPVGHIGGRERLHATLNGEYLGWHGSLSWNRSDFYDLFGPTKRSRKGLAARFGHDWLLIYDEPRRLDLVTELAYFDKIDTLPTAQNVTTPFTRLATGDVALKYTDVRRSLGAVEDEQGLTWAVALHTSLAQGVVSPQLRGAFDFGFPLPLQHSSVWLRSAAGVARGDRDNPIVNFYFGGFGNNYVDDGSINRYRDYYSLPGFRINEIGARSFVRELAEWNVPPVVFESVGTPGFYLTWLRPSVFVAGLWTEPGNAERRTSYASAGAQADLRFTILHRYEMTLSAGYAIGYQGSRRAGNEWMLSLKII